MQLFSLITDADTYFRMFHDTKVNISTKYSLWLWRILFTQICKVDNIIQLLNQALKHTSIIEDMQ